MSHYEVGDKVRVKAGLDTSVLTHAQYADLLEYYQDGSKALVVESVEVDNDGEWYRFDTHYLLCDIEFETHELESADE